MIFEGENKTFQCCFSKERQHWKQKMSLQNKNVSFDRHTIKAKKKKKIPAQEKSNKKKIWFYINNKV